MTLWFLTLLLLQPPLPAIKVPAEVRVESGDFVVVRAETAGKVVRWKAIDPGLSILPSDLLKDDRSFVAVAKAKSARVRVIAWTAVADVPSDAAECVVVVGGAPIPPGPGPGPGPGPSPTPTPPEQKATAATYIYEKDQGGVPPPVASALNRLNRERGIVATQFENDTRDGAGEIPEQYRTAVAAARTAGLPALVVTSADKGVLRVVKAPKSEAEIMEAWQW